MAKKNEYGKAGVLIPGFLMLGIGIGLWTGNVAAWTMIGLGAGFIGMFIASKR